ncbi:chitin synthase-domain-containing protein [Chytridium lagenaria]|nr:chitin synthase-domain-containing protein [Chytridium lagenaria]
MSAPPPLGYNNGQPVYYPQGGNVPPPGPPPPEQQGLLNNNAYPGPNPDSNLYRRPTAILKTLGRGNTSYANPSNEPRTMVRPDRHVDLPRMLTTARPLREFEQTPPTAAKVATLKRQAQQKKPRWGPANPWVAFSWAVTCCFPFFCLSMCGIKGPGPQQAWREKVALCWIVLGLSGIVVFYIVFFNGLLCPTKLMERNNIQLNPANGFVVRGVMYTTNKVKSPFGNLFQDLVFAFPGVDLTSQFSEPFEVTNACSSHIAPFATLKYPCSNDPNGCLDVNQLSLQDGGDYGFVRYERGSQPNFKFDPNVILSYDDIKRRNLTVINQKVVNLNFYLSSFPDPIPDDPVDTFIRTAHTLGDGTLYIARNPGIRSAVEECVTRKYFAGTTSILPTQCILSIMITMITTVMILGIVVIRFLMSIVFAWFVAARLSRTPTPDKIRERDYYMIKPNTPLLRVQNDDGDTSFASSQVGGYLAAGNAVNPKRTACEQSLRNTMESLAATEYHDEKKLLFIIADGIITGKGNPKSTPDTIIDMIELDTELGKNPKPYSYIACASGSKQLNMARVYCGKFAHKGRLIPTVVVVKCGTEEERAAGVKPGNRGKRDSQLILMKFFMRVTLRDRMCPLDFDLFRKIHHITGFTPDFYEIVLMVDADTMVISDSLRAMTNSMYNDPKIMGLCGETRIDNKRQSWVTMIQVFEYFISHHLGKGFESMFGGVTCLPGCFCMYRIKSRRGDEWIPVLVNPDIVEEYSTNEVESLHQKNLLLLGEDRFLTTLMLRTFPKRKMMFVPKALCRTVVPDDFMTLLSQRRRWINSTIHNLMELVKLRNLCGTFCFSMQFVVFMDLIGTAILPVSLCLTYYLIYVSIAKNKYVDIASWLNLAALVFVIFMPALLVMLTSRKMSYVLWMMLYLVALPIWQFILPLYAFWNFDDFSWGATRQVAGAKDEKSGHGDSHGDFDASAVPFLRWEDYEVAWRRNVNDRRSRMSMATPSIDGRPGSQMSFGSGNGSTIDVDADEDEFLVRR